VRGATSEMAEGKFLLGMGGRNNKTPVLPTRPGHARKTLQSSVKVQPQRTKESIKDAKQFFNPQKMNVTLVKEEPYRGRKTLLNKVQAWNIKRMRVRQGALAVYNEDTGVKLSRLYPTISS